MLVWAMAPAPRIQTNLRDLRLAHGYSQEWLAREVGVSRQTIVNIERGITIPNVLLAIAIGAVLAVAVDKLFRPAGGLGGA
jgi:putative transcriptional regulator